MFNMKAIQFKVAYLYCGIRQLYDKLWFKCINGLLLLGV